MLNAGNMRPTIGTSMDGKYDAVIVIYCKFKFILLYYL